MSIAWQPWSAEAFAAARRERKRILLWITAAWSTGCREMATGSYADSAVAAEIAAHYVPIRLDADERPDLAERYGLGGLPTTAILETDGRLIGGGTFVPAHRLHRALAHLASSSDSELASPVVATDGRGARTATAVDDLAIHAMVQGLYDHAHGGCGGAPKFPHVAPIRLALRLTPSAPDETGRGWALQSLDAIGWGGLSDSDGGFFHYCDGADWTAPRPEKLLALNASLLELFSEAAAAGCGERYLDRAAATVAFIDGALRRADGAWRVAAGPGPSRVLTDANALTVSAMLRAAAALDDADLGSRAIHTLEDVLVASYKPGDGVAHYGGGTRGLLTDQVAMAAATLDAWEASGRMPYRMMAEELMRFAMRTMWDEQEGGFFDRTRALAATDPPASPTLKPFVLNCVAAEVASRLAVTTGDDSFAAICRDILAAMAPLAMHQGPLAAHYLLARHVQLPVPLR